MRENVHVKGRRYLTEARLTVVSVAGDDVLATCRGGGEVHDLGHTPGRGWWCTCPVRGLCSHLVALQLVAIRRGRWDQVTHPHPHDDHTHRGVEHQHDDRQRSA